MLTRVKSTDGFLKRKWQFISYLQKGFSPFMRIIIGIILQSFMQLIYPFVKENLLVDN